MLGFKVRRVVVKIRYLIMTLLFLFQFTFAKIWLLHAQFEIRQKNLQNARKIMVRLDSLIADMLVVRVSAYTHRHTFWSYSQNGTHMHHFFFSPRAQRLVNAQRTNC